MHQKRLPYVRNMISPDPFPTISARRKPVNIIKRMRRRKVNTSWAASSHRMEPTRSEPSAGMRNRLLTMENFMFSARFGARA